MHFLTILAYQNALKLTFGNLEFQVFSAEGPSDSPLSEEGVKKGGRGKGKEEGDGLEEGEERGRGREGRAG